MKQVTNEIYGNWIPEEFCWKNFKIRKDVANISFPKLFNRRNLRNLKTLIKEGGSCLAKFGDEEREDLRYFCLVITRLTHAVGGVLISHDPGTFFNSTDDVNVDFVLDLDTRLEEMAWLTGVISE